MAKTLMETWSYKLQKPIFGGRRIRSVSRPRNFPMSTEQNTFFDCGLVVALGLKRDVSSKTILVHLWLDRFGWAMEQPNRPANKLLLEIGPEAWWDRARPIYDHAIRKIDHDTQRLAGFGKPVDLFVEGRYCFTVDEARQRFILGAVSNASHGVSVVASDAARMREIVAAIDSLPDTSAWHKMLMEHRAYMIFCQAMFGNQTMRGLLFDLPPLAVALRLLAEALDNSY